jgi:hypothetical protein
MATQTGIPSRRGLVLSPVKPLPQPEAQPVGASPQEQRQAILSLQQQMQTKAEQSNRLLNLIKALEQRVDAMDQLLSRRINEMQFSDVLANRPPAGLQDRLFIATDQAAGSNAYYDTGAAWVLI